MRFRVKSSSVAPADAFRRERRRWRIRGDGGGGGGGRENTRRVVVDEVVRERKDASRAPAEENMGEFNFYVTLHLRSLATGAIVCRLRGSAAKRHSIAGLHLRFSIMETQRAPGAIRASPAFSHPLPPSGRPVSPSESTLFSYSLFRCVLARRKNGRE